MSKLGGYTSSMDDLAAVCHARQRDCSVAHTSHDVPVEFVPAVADVVRLLQAGASGKGGRGAGSLLSAIPPSSSNSAVCR